MHRFKFHKIGLFFWLALGFLACTKDGLFDYSNLKQNAEWLFPIVKTKISAEQVSKLTDSHYDIGAFTFDVPFINTSAPIPPISGQTIGPLPLEDTDSIYIQFRSDSATLKIFITNNFPINIKAGTKVEIRNSLINTNVVFSGVVLRDIAAKGGKDSVIISKVVTTPWADNKLEFYFVDFASDGSSSVENFGIYNNLDVNLKIDVIHLNEAILNGNIEYFVTDTTDFKFGSNKNEPNDAHIESGILNLFIKNGVPLNYTIQGYFLDENYMIVDSLFEQAYVPAPGIDALGYAINSTINEVKITSVLSNEKYSNLRAFSKHIYYRLKFTSQPLPVRLTHDNYVGLQLTADVKTSFDF